MQIKAPVVLFAYNKPDTTKKVLKTLKKVNLSKIYLVLDFPPKGNNKDTYFKTKKLFQEFNHGAKIEHIFADSHMGLNKRFHSALNYIFDIEQKLIILEDDTLPSKTFFRFCDELLEKYQDNYKISQINGYNYRSKINIHESYYFGNISEIWGWATWSDRWLSYNNKDFEKWDKLKNDESYTKNFVNSMEYDYYYKLFEDASRGIVSSWEYNWVFSLKLNNLISIFPKKSLVKNLGFGHKGATHTHQKLKYLSITKNKKYNIQFPLIHPTNIQHDNEQIKKDIEKRLLQNSQLSNIIYHLKKIIKLIENYIK